MKIIDDKHVEQVMGDRNTYSDNSVREYANVCKIVANEKKVLFLDLYTEMLKEGDKFKDMLSDGVHFSLIGGNFLYEKLEFYLNNYSINIIDGRAGAREEFIYKGVTTGVNNKNYIYIVLLILITM